MYPWNRLLLLMVNCESMVLKLKSPQTFTEEYFSTRDDAFMFYTGLPNFMCVKLFLSLSYHPLQEPTS